MKYSHILTNFTGKKVFLLIDMIVSFSVGNFLSFKDKVTISFIPQPIKDNEKDSVFSTTHSGLRLLKGGAIIGANASGKSNVLKAISFMRSFVVGSWHMGATDPISVEAFKLNPKNIGLPSYFEMEFLIEDIRYRYGFEVTKYQVKKEWFYFSSKKKEKKYFERLENLIDELKDFEEGLRFKSQTKANALYLSTVAQYNGKISLLVSKWFQNLVIVSDTDYANFIPTTFSKIDKNSEYKSYIKKIVSLVDLGFDEIEVIPITVDNNILNQLPEEIRKQIKNTQQLQFKTVHKRYDSTGNAIENVHFDLMKEESQGTIKYIALAGPIVECLIEGKPLLIDELDSRLHPHLTSAIIKIFNSKNHNPNNSQLIFTSHNHNFLDEKILRRDQIFFTNKNIRG